MSPCISKKYIRTIEYEIHSVCKSRLLRRSILRSRFTASGYGADSTVFDQPHPRIAYISHDDLTVFTENDRMRRNEHRGVGFPVFKTRCPWNARQSGPFMEISCSRELNVAS